MMGSDRGFRRSRVGLPIFDESGNRPKRQTAAPQPGTGYYDIPFLKPPTWRWEISSYFFLESISSGAYLIATIADLVDSDRYRRLSDTGYALAAATLAPCPPLLIADLGRPERFHHMLRIFKRSSVMSHGSWSLLGYSVPLGLLVGPRILESVGVTSDLLDAIDEQRVRRAIAVTGAPLALMLTTYPGVLLSTTANPFWSRTRLLGTVFASSAIHAGASALVLLGERRGSNPEAERLERIEQIAALAQATSLFSLIALTGRFARPLLTGKQSRTFWIGAVGIGIALPVLLRILGRRGSRTARIGRIFGSVFSLVGSFALKWAITKGGTDAARDAELGRESKRSGRPSDGWNARSRPELTE